MRSGMPLPKAIQNAPDLAIGLGFYYNAFFTLSPDRPLGFGEGPIPLSSIYAFCMYTGLQGEEVEDFVYLIREMDVKYLNHKGKKSKEKTSGKP